MFLNHEYHSTGTHLHRKFKLPSYLEPSAKLRIPVPCFLPSKYCPSYLAPSGQFSTPLPCCLSFSHYTDKRTLYLSLIFRTVYVYICAFSISFIIFPLPIINISICMYQFTLFSKEKLPFLTIYLLPILPHILNHLAISISHNHLSFHFSTHLHRQPPILVIWGVASFSLSYSLCFLLDRFPLSCLPHSC
jgi:hypothetical protein